MFLGMVLTILSSELISRGDNESDIMKPHMLIDMGESFLARGKSGACA